MALILLARKGKGRVGTLLRMQSPADFSVNGLEVGDALMCYLVSGLEVRIALILYAHQGRS